MAAKSAKKKRSRPEQSRDGGVNTPACEEDEDEAKLSEGGAKDEEDAQDEELASCIVIFGWCKKTTIYRFHISRYSDQVTELKQLIKQEFGWSWAKQRLFYKFLQLPESEHLQQLPDWSDVKAKNFLHLFVDGSPQLPENVLRPLYPEATAKDLLELNRDPLAPASDSSSILESWPQPRDWHAELMATRCMPTETLLEKLEKEKAMYELMENFVHAAKAAAMVVLNKQVDPVHMQELYGMGGDKYVVGGVLLRRAQEWEILQQSTGEGDAAFKVAGHELKGLQALASVAPPAAVVPLCCVVDCYGVRFLAMSVVPISRGSVAYGSVTDGLVIHTQDELAVETFSCIADSLNLKRHRAVERLSGQEVLLSLPYTIQAFNVSGSSGSMRYNTDTSLSEISNDSLQPSDRHFIVMSAGRLLPPDTGTNATASGAGASSSVEEVTCLLRKEFVSRWSHHNELEDGFVMYTSLEPRVCDVSGKVILDYEYYTYDKRGCDISLEAWDATDPEHLPYPKDKFVSVSVPERLRVVYWRNQAGEIRFVRPTKLTPLNPDAHCISDEAEPGCITDGDELRAASHALQEIVIPDFIQELDELECEPTTGRQLVEEMHKRGINTRYLGRIANESRYNHLRELAVREMLARTIKVLIRDGLSFLVEPDEEDAKAVVVHYLNECLTRVESDAHVTIWKYIDELLFKKYGFSTGTGAGGSQQVPVLNKIYLMGLVHSIADKCGFKLEKFKGIDFEAELPFHVRDIASVHPTVKYQEATSTEVVELLQRANELDFKGKRSLWYLVGGPERAQATELFREALRLCDYVYGPTHMLTAKVFLEAAEQLESRHSENGRPENSRWNKCAKIETDELSREAEDYYRRALRILEGSVGIYDLRVAQCYLALSRICKEEGEKVQLEYTFTAIDIIETLLGFMHPETAAVYTQLALQHQEMEEMKMAEDAAPCMRKAFVIHMSLFGKDHELTQHTYKLLQGIEISVNSGLEDAPMSELIARIEELEFGPGD